MINKSDFVSSRNYFVISIMHYCLWPVYVLTRYFFEKKGNDKRILFVELGHMGDMLSTATVIGLVKENRKDSHITCLCSPSAAVVLENNPFVNEVKVIETPYWYIKTGRAGKASFFSSFTGFLRNMRSANAGTVVNVRATSYHVDHIATWLAGIRERVGFGNKGLGYMLTFSGSAPSSVPIPLQKLNLISDWLGLKIRRDTLIPSFFPGKGSAFRAEQLLHEMELSSENAIIGINPGAQHNFLWPEKSFVELCKLIHHEGKGKILFLGVGAHLEMIGRIREKLLFKTYSAVGKTKLDELFELLRRLTLLITVDTGIRHLANAARIPVVAMRFGADGYDRYGKYTDQERVIFNRVVCAPCGRETCPLPEMVCMTGILPREVFDAATSVVNGTASGNKD